MASQQTQIASGEKRLLMAENILRKGDVNVFADTQQT
jgi:hypothetical protein